MKVKMLKRAGKYITGKTYTDIPVKYEKYLLDNGYATKAITNKQKNKAIKNAPHNKQDFVGNKDMK